MSASPLNLDVTKRTRYISNLWSLSVLLAVVVGAYASWRDLRDSDSTQSGKIEQVRQLGESRYIQQERHLTSTDTRLSVLEIQVTKTDATMAQILDTVVWLREHQEYKDRQEKRNQ